MRSHRFPVFTALWLLSAAWSLPALGNGGPFIIKYPGGDPAAHGTLARLAPDLRPGREERLRVVKEDLRIAFIPPEREGMPLLGPPEGPSPGGPRPLDPSLPKLNPPPIVDVAAAYTIENPTDAEIEVDFGFPILRGIYIHPYSMSISPDAHVKLDDAYISSDLISNSAIYGHIRQRARKAVDDYVAADKQLSDLVTEIRKGIVRQRAREAVAAASKSSSVPTSAVASDPAMNMLLAVDDTKDPARKSARDALFAYTAGQLKWDERLSTLFLEYVSLDLGSMGASAWDRPRQDIFSMNNQLSGGNLGPLASIGEQKATQLFIELARKFDPKAASSYEDIFVAWGGDVRERSCDLKTGQVRPREITLDEPHARTFSQLTDTADPTIYARLRYFNERIQMSPGERASCEVILKNLPIVFTFAPMNLLHYRPKFPPHSTHVLTVAYRQYAYQDTAEPRSYQAAYVLHPASLWKDFGLINLEIGRPEGVTMRANAACQEAGVEERELGLYPSNKVKTKLAIARATLTEKTGELFVGIDAAEWDKQQKQAQEMRLKPAAPVPPVVQAAGK